MQYKMEKPVRGTIGEVKYRCVIEWRNGTFIADEPVPSGGQDSGPDPFTLFLSSLASCTLATLRMYIDRKGWDIPSITVNCNMWQRISDGKLTSFIDRDVYFHPDADPEQKERLLQIAKACPISKMLENTMVIRTEINGGEAYTEEMIARADNH
ncbi:OsmC family protein [Chitinophaga sp.]|uniref:OsmC family protein n=1 Tax=Chitinophaga sp. TaxID=1869181 RepID=UPI00262F4702|nr:OsmC family protein [uncultured Chitinophaga sp.]